MGSPGATSGPERPLLATLAERVRRVRGERGWSRARLAERSGLSLRFLARVESGEGNISVLRLAALAEALDTTPDRLLRDEIAERPVIALVGMRGAGKSTIGPLLARELGLPFHEVDDRIVDTAGLPLSQIFELHGEGYYRRLERDALGEILHAGQPAVVATGGGVVNETATWNLLLQRARVVWLRARPEDHWERVVAQGDRRPMRDHPDAMDELRSMLEEREPRYAQANHVVDTVGSEPRRIAEHLSRLLSENAR